MSGMDDEPEPLQTPGAEAEPASATPKPAPESPALVNALALGMTLTAAGVLAYAFDPARAGQTSMLVALGAFYAALTAAALYRLHRRGELGRRFRPARGDITLAAVTAGVLYGAVRIGAMVLAPAGSPHELWLARIYLQIGEAGAPERRLLGVAVFTVAALEEIAWRGLLMRSIQDSAGPLRACVITTLLYAVAHLPTLSLLRMPGAGYNPLVVLAALACGLVWSLMVLRTGRVTPALLAHALFSWSIIEFPLWQPFA
jgi:membrane protease YdiL (CAAX protease family)